MFVSDTLLTQMKSNMSTIGVCQTCLLNNSFPSWLLIVSNCLMLLLECPTVWWLCSFLFATLDIIATWVILERIYWRRIKVYFFDQWGEVQGHYAENRQATSLQAILTLTWYLIRRYTYLRIIELLPQKTLERMNLSTYRDRDA